MGGTSGIGLYTAREFVRETSSPTVYLVGRNERYAGEIIDEFKSLNGEVKISFIKADVSLLKEVDSACDFIQKQVIHVNLLFLSCGIFTLNRREGRFEYPFRFHESNRCLETVEGLDRKLSLHYYARMRFIHNLIPLLNNVGQTGHSNNALSRVISVLGAGHETELRLDDLDLRKHYSVQAYDVHATTMTSLMVKEFASRNPSIIFIHSYPGIVKSRISREAGPVMSHIIRSAMFLGRLWMVPGQESGERHLFAATSIQFSPEAETPVGGDSSGAYLLSWDGSEVGNERLLKDYSAKGVRSRVWKHTEEMFRKALNYEDN